MSDCQLQPPVAFIIFNRQDTTERVFAENAEARPPKLLVVGYFRFDLWAGLRLRTGRKYPAPSCLTAATAVKGMDQSPKGDVLALNALSMNKEITDFPPSIFDRET